MKKETVKQRLEQYASTLKSKYSMGETIDISVKLKDGSVISFQKDNRRYYEGRGAKYNKNIKHGEIIETLTLSEFNKKYSEIFGTPKQIAERNKARAVYKKEQKEKRNRIVEAEKSDIYSIKDNYVELSDAEYYGRSFDAERLAKTLDISVEDALLLNSQGKTYVFAKQKSTGKILELYHPSLDCNELSIYVGEATPERLKEFNHKEWANAPFAGLVGQTSNENHFVC